MPVRKAVKRKAEKVDSDAKMVKHDQVCEKEDALSDSDSGVEDVENILDVDLNKLTKKELLALCAERKIEARGNKKELVSALEKAKVALQTPEAISAEDVEEEIKLTEVDALVESTVAIASSEAIEPVESTDTQEECTKKSTEPVESVNYAEMTKKELEKLCIGKNLPVKGNKTDLISRLEASSEDNPSIIKPNTPKEPATEPINETMEEPVNMIELENENSEESPVDSSTEKTDAGGAESVIEQEKTLVEESAAGPTDDTGVDADAESVVEAETIVATAVESTLAQTAEPTIDLAVKLVMDTANVITTESKTEPVQDLYALTKRELEKLCKSKGLSTKGNKKDLIASLEESSAVPKDDTEQADEHVESASISECEATDEPESIAEPEAPIESQTVIEESKSITEPETAVELYTATDRVVSKAEPATVMEETESSDETEAADEPRTAIKKNVSIPETEAADKITEDPADIAEVEAEKAVEPETAVETKSAVTDLTKLTKKNLEKLCLEKNLPIKGNKKDLIKMIEKTTEELNEEAILPETPEQIQLVELEESVSEAELSSTEISEENVQEITNEDIPAKDQEEDSVSDKALKESVTIPLSDVNTLSILDLMQMKKTGELDQEELYRIFLTSAQNDISQSQKISELEKRLEDAEARIEKLEVVSASDSKAATVADVEELVAERIDEFSEPEPVPESEPVTESEPDPVAEPEPVTESEPEPAADTEPVTESEPGTEPAPESEPDPVAEPAPVTESDPIPETLDEMESKSNSENVPSEETEEAQEDDITTKIENMSKADFRATRKRAKASGSSQSQRQVRAKRSKI